MRLTLPIHGAKTAMLWMPTTICSRNHSSRMGAYTPPRCCDPRGCTANSRARTPMEMPAMEDWGNDGALTEMAPKAPKTAAYPQLQHSMPPILHSNSLFAIACNIRSCKKGKRKEKTMLFVVDLRKALGQDMLGFPVGVTSCNVCDNICMGNEAVVHSRLHDREQANNGE